MCGTDRHEVFVARGPVVQPLLSLGTCCGSNPRLGVLPWLSAGGVGIDTSIDYRDQPGAFGYQRQIFATGFLLVAGDST